MGYNTRYGIVSGHPPRPHDALITSRSGSSALSPSGTLLAIANLGSGIDWLSIPERRFLSTTRYDLTDRTSITGEVYIVSIRFLDERTVIVGDNRSQLIIATLGMATNPHVYKPPLKNKGRESSSPFMMRTLRDIDLDIRSLVRLG